MKSVLPSHIPSIPLILRGLQNISGRVQSECGSSSHARLRTKVPGKVVAVPNRESNSRQTWEKTESCPAQKRDISSITNSDFLGTPTIFLQKDDQCQHWAV